VNPYEREALYMGAKDHAFAQKDAEPFEAALEWLQAREWADVGRAEAEKMAEKVARRVKHVRASQS
jgi:aminopeptidase N